MELNQNKNFKYATIGFLVSVGFRILEKVWNLHGVVVVVTGGLCVGAGISSVLSCCGREDAPC